MDYRSINDQIRIPNNAIGTQVAWDLSYNPESVAGANGLHIFRPHDRVVRVDGRVGTVRSRTALTATVVWDDDRQNPEVIDQFDERYQVWKRR